MRPGSLRYLFAWIVPADLCSAIATCRSPIGAGFAARQPHYQPHYQLHYKGSHLQVCCLYSHCGCSSDGASELAGAFAACRTAAKRLAISAAVAPAPSPLSMLTTT